jgi:hypothetical protein
VGEGLVLLTVVVVCQQQLSSETQQDLVMQ